MGFLTVIAPEVRATATVATIIKIRTVVITYIIVPLAVDFSHGVHII